MPPSLTSIVAVRPIASSKQHLMAKWVRAVWCTGECTWRVDIGHSSIQSRVMPLGRVANGDRHPQQQWPHILKDPRTCSALHSVQFGTYRESAKGGHWKARSPVNRLHVSVPLKTIPTHLADSLINNFGGNVALMTLSIEA